MSYKNQQYLIMSLAAAAQPVSQLWLDRYPIVKIDATEEEEAVLYAEADGLTRLEAIEKLDEQNKSGKFAGLYIKWNIDAQGEFTRPKDAVLDEDGAELEPAVLQTHVAFNLMDATSDLLLPMLMEAQAAVDEGVIPSINVTLLNRSDYAAKTASK